MEIIRLKAAIQKALSSIGKKNGSAPPESNSNTFPIAYELFVASEIRSAAGKRYDAAKAAAVDAGVIDEAKAIEGSEVTVFNNKYFDVTMKKASSSSTIDRTMLKNAMSKNGIKPDLIEKIMEEGSKPRKGAVTIGFALKG